MSSFIWRDIDPVFWKKVQAKVQSEGITIKELLMKLVTQWLGVVALAIVSASLVGCVTRDSSPTGPSPSVFAPPPSSTPSPSPSPSPAPSGAPFSLHLDATGAVRADPLNPWQTTLRATMSPTVTSAPVGATINCGNGTPTTSLSGPRAAWTVSCVFPTMGIYQVTATAIADTGFVATDTLTVTVNARASDPSPAPTVPGTITFSAVRANGSATAAEWQFVISGSTTLTMFNWEFGDGSGTSTSSRTASHVYTVAGTYTVQVIGSTDSGATTTPATKDIVVTIP